MSGRKKTAAFSTASHVAGHLFAIILFASIFLMQGQDERDAQDANAFINAFARQNSQGAAK